MVYLVQNFFIDEITIQRYKSIKEVTVNLKDFNVLVGKNNVGKTNFLDCLEFISELAQDSLNNILYKRGGYESVIYGGSELLNVHIYLRLSDGRGKSYTYDVSFNDSGFIDESLSENNIIIMNREEGGSHIAIFDKGNKITGWGVDKRTSILFFYERNELSKNDMYFNPTLINIINYLKSWKFYNLDPSVMRTVSTVKKTYDIGKKGVDLSRTLHSIRSSHLNIFQDIVDSLKSGIDEIEELYSLLDESDPAKTYISIKEKNFVTHFNLNQLSDGILVILAHLTIIYTPERKGLICIEEPESYIHPKLMRYLRDVLKSSNSQVIAVTHSPHFADALKPEDVFIVKKIEGHTILEEVTSQSQLLKYLKTLTLGELLYSEETDDEIYRKDAN